MISTRRRKFLNSSRIREDSASARTLTSSATIDKLLKHFRRDVLVGILTIILTVMVLVAKNFIKREPSEITILKQKVSQAYLDALEASNLNPKSLSEGHPKP